MLVVTVFAGCRPFEKDELPLAAELGRALGPVASEVRLGGYNGLMEEVSKHVAAAGGRVVAPLLDHSEAWGPMNPHVHQVVRCATPSERMNFYLECDLIVALPGGVGTLYEIATALWHTTNFASTPIWFIGHKCRLLYDLLVEHEWIVQTPTRPTGHIRLLRDAEEFTASLLGLTRSIAPSPTQKTSSHLLRCLDQAVLTGSFKLPTGDTVERYFDEYRITANHGALAACTSEMIRLLTEVGPVDGLVGVATAGIPFATLISQRLRLPLSILRASARPYGTATALEGPSTQGRRVVVIDSVLSTGGTLLHAARLVRQHDAKVIAMIVLLDRERGGRAKLETEGLTVRAVATWRQLAGAAA